MKNFKVKWLLLSIILSVASINNAWGWGTISLNGNFTGNNWGSATYNINYSIGDGGAHTFLPIYTSSGDKYWRLYHSGDGGNYTLSPASDNYVISYGTHYQVKGNGDKNFKTNVNAGIIAVHSSQVNTAYASGSYTEPAVWLERPTIYIWHNWSGTTSNWGNNGGAGQKAMTDNNDGTYTYDGVYSASGTNVGIQGEVAIKKYFADNVTTKVGSPASGDKCRFTWNPNGNSDPYVGYDAETKHRGSLTITKILTITYDGNGKTSGSIPSNTDAVYNQASTLATNTGSLAKTNYHFNGWNTKADGKGTHYDAGGSITVTTNTKLYAEWVDEWAIQGSGTEMGAWSDYKYLSYSGTANTFSGTIDLAANTTYVFKIRNRNTGALWGYGDNDYQLAFVGQGSAYAWNIESTDGKKNLVLMTANAGTYTFTWNSSTKRLTVGFPSQTHPNNNFIYFKNSGASAYSSVNAHIWGGTASTGFYRLPTLPTISFAGETYYYAAIGDNTKCLFADGEVNPSTKTSDQTSISSNKGKYYDLASSTWKDFTVTVSLNNQSATTAGAASVTATYNAAMPSIAADKPAKTGYTWGGYFKEVAGGSTQYYLYTGASAHVWDQTGASPSIYAKWTQNITLNQNGATTSGSTSLAATYNAVLDASGITNPSRTNYTFAGWTNGEGGTGTVVINTSKAVQTVASWTDGSKKWIHDGGSTLYAKWTENLHDVAVAAGDHGSVSVDEVTNIGVATASGTITATADEGYHFTGWTIPSGVTLASGTTSSESITINAIADSKTITANFAANTFTVHFNDNYPSGTTGSGSMSNESFTYNTTKILTANDFTCEGYTFDGWKIDNAGDVIAGGTDGCTLTTGNGVTVQLYAQWADNNKYYFKGGKSGSETDWSAAENWTKGAAPSSADHEVYILAPVKISSGTVHVKSVDIITEGTYDPIVGDDVEASSSKLTIGTGAMLIVDGKVQNYNISNTKADSTRTSTLHIESDGTHGNGALVWGETNSTPGYAQVDFYTKSHGEKDQNSSINQYIGTPFSNEQSILYQYYYSWLFKIKRTAGVLDWDLMSGDESMNEFEGYNLITAYDKGTVYQMEGILVSNEDVELNGSSTPALVYTSGTGSNPNNENVLANSWVAPILIKNFVDDDFTNVDKSIYIFNAGSPNDALSVGEAGNYTTYSISTIKENETNEVIPSMQSFSVYTSGESPSLTLNYSNLVKANASNSIIEPNHAPSRYSNNQMDLLKVRAEGANGWADVLKVYIRDDFSTDFENGWDAHKMYGYPEAPQLYAVTTDGNMAINCVPTADNNVLGFTPGSEDNEYTFSFTYDGDEEYYLKDTKLNIETLINTEATYTFTSEAEDSDMRFIIKRAPAVATDAETVSGDRLAVSGVQKIMHNGQLYIIRDGGIYSTDGQMVK